MTPDDARTGVLLVRVWVHDGRLVARVHTWAMDEADQQAVVVVGAPAIIERVLDWIGSFDETLV